MNGWMNQKMGNGNAGCGAGVSVSRSTQLSSSVAVFYLVWPVLLATAGDVDEPILCNYHQGRPLRTPSIFLVSNPFWIATGG